MVIIKQKTHKSSNKQTFIQGRGYADGIIESIKNIALSGLSEENKILISKIFPNKTNKINTESKKLLEDMSNEKTESGITKKF
jgi:hypothetical protein